MDNARRSDPSGSDWLEQKAIASDGVANTYFGYAIAISGDTAFVGSATAGGGSPQQGAVYVFTRSGSQWSEVQKLTAADGANGDSFGASIAVSGGTVLIGANMAGIGSNPGQGAVYAFTETNGTWNQVQKLSAADGTTYSFFGNTVALNGDVALVSASGAVVGKNASQGAAYVFKRTAGTWSEVQKLFADDGVSYERFGGWVGLSGDSAFVGSVGATVGGNPVQGAAYVFTNSGGTWRQTQKIVADDGEAYEMFGVPFAIAGDTALIAASEAAVGGHASQGAVYVFRNSGDHWTQVQKFTGNDSVAGDGFGSSVAIEGNTAIVGANQYYSSGSGVAYAFDKVDGTWGEVYKLIPSDGAVHDNFGVSAEIAGGVVLIGASMAGVAGNIEQGSAYFYTLPASPPVATVAPGSLTFTLVAGAEKAVALSVINEGGSDLTYVVAEAVSADGCAVGAELSWLREAPASGSVASAASQDVTVTADATALAPGDYSGLLCITTNDPDNSLIKIPVSLRVNLNDTVFKDGFDGS